MVAEGNLGLCRDQVYDSISNPSTGHLSCFPRSTQDEMELDLWRTASSRDCLAEFGTDFGIYRDPASSNRL